MKIHSIGILGQPIFSFIPHKHDSWEFVYYLSGSGILIIGDQSYAFREGDLVAQPPNISHSEFSTEGFQNIHILVEEPPLAAVPIWRVHDNTSNDLRALLMMLYRNQYWNIQPNQAVLGSLSDLFFLYAQMLHSAAPSNGYVEQMKSFMIANLSNPDFSLKEMYQCIHLNGDYARRLFQQEMKCTPLAYLTQLRIRHACCLLNNMENHIPIQEVSHLVGIRDPYYFSRLFKSAMGVSPQNWLKTKCSSNT